MPIYYSDETKGFYDTESIKYHSLPNLLIEITKEERDNLINELNGNNKVIVIIDNAITLQNQPPLSWEQIRGVRNILLQKSDYTQLPDFPAEKKTEWATYRQLLRDIPQTYATPQEVIWPKEPT